MARSRRTLIQKDNVTSLAEAREKREAQKKAAESTSKSDNPGDGLSTEADAKQKDAATDVSTGQNAVEEIEGKADDAVPARRRSDKTTEQTATKTKKRKVSNRTYNKEKVEALKAAISEGRYQIDHRRVADKFIERESP